MPLLVGQVSNLRADFQAALAGPLRDSHNRESA